MGRRLVASALLLLALGGCGVDQPDARDRRGTPAPGLPGSYRSLDCFGDHLAARRADGVDLIGQRPGGDLEVTWAAGLPASPQTAVSVTGRGVVVAAVGSRGSPSLRWLRDGQVTGTADLPGAGVVSLAGWPSRGGAARVVAGVGRRVVVAAPDAPPTTLRTFDRAVLGVASSPRPTRAWVLVAGAAGEPARLVSLDDSGGVRSSRSIGEPDDDVMGPFGADRFVAAAVVHTAPHESTVTVVDPRGRLAGRPTTVPMAVTTMRLDGSVWWLGGWSDRATSDPGRGDHRPALVQVGARGGDWYRVIDLATTPGQRRGPATVVGVASCSVRIVAAVDGPAGSLLAFDYRSYG